MMQHTNVTLANIAAEVATKLLFSTNVLDGNLLSSLLVLFLYPNSRQDYGKTDCDIDAKDVGSPLRLQQLLCLFFPAFCMKAEECRNTLLDSIETALDVALDYSPETKSRNRGVPFPLIEIVDYVYSVVLDTGAASEQTAINDTSASYDAQDFDPSLSASLQVARFLIRNEARLNNITQLRPLCKFLGNQEIRPEDNDKRLLGKLKDFLEELSFLEDLSSVRALRPLIESLSCIKGYEDNYEENEADDCEDGTCKSTHADDETISENNREDKNFESTRDTTIDGGMIRDNSIVCLPSVNKENPPYITLTTTKTRRSSTQSNVSVLESLDCVNR